MTKSCVGGIQVHNPAVQLAPHRVAIPQAKLASGPIPNSGLGTFEQLEQFADPSTRDLGRLLKRLVLCSDPPNPPGVSVPARISQRVLSVAFDRVVPITNIELSGLKATAAAGVVSPKSDSMMALPNHRFGSKTIKDLSSASSRHKFRIKSFQNFAGIVDTELPIDNAEFVIGPCGPSTDFALKVCQVTDATAR